MKRFYSLVLIFALLIQFSIPVFAHYDEAYIFSKSLKSDRSSWMKSIRDDVRMNDLSIPGSHNTMTDKFLEPSYQNQEADLSEQLKAGIRYIDIRVREHLGTSETLQIAHGRGYAGYSFYDGCKMLESFLATNPSETVYMRFKKEDKTPDSKMHEYVDAAFKRFPNLFWDNKGYSSANPTIGETRGKVVFISDVWGVRQGINYRNFITQDEYEVGSNWDLHPKWQKVLGFFTRIKTEKANPSNANKGYMNYLNISTGVFPFFGASGHGDPGTNANRLLTGATTLTHGPDRWPEFPRVNWSSGMASIAFEGLNTLTADYIENKAPYDYLGFVVADFPGPRLINNIINSNYRHTVDYSPIKDGSYTIGVHRPENLAYVNNENSKETVYTYGNLTNMGDKAVWEIKHIGNDMYTIQNKYSGLFLDVPNSSTSDNTLLIQFPFNGGNNQLFTIVKDKTPNKNSYVVTNVNSNKAISQNSNTLVQHKTPIHNNIILTPYK